MWLMVIHQIMEIQTYWILKCVVMTILYGQFTQLGRLKFGGITQQIHYHFDGETQEWILGNTSQQGRYVLSKASWGYSNIRIVITNHEVSVR
jgi:hypothetical protein